MKLIFLKFLYQSCILSSFLPNLSLIKKTQCYLRHLRLLHPLLRVAGLSISPASCSVALQRLSRHSSTNLASPSLYLAFSHIWAPSPTSLRSFLYHQCLHPILGSHLSSTFVNPRRRQQHQIWVWKIL
uniref:Uncharacterized protein n=1 Tax=Opuntia streptacantha TaxID=393608 RepID=A0A7C9EKP0_OPUST